MTKNKVTEIRLVEIGKYVHVICIPLKLSYLVENLEDAGRDIVDLIDQHPECRFEIKMERA